MRGEKNKTPLLRILFFLIVINTFFIPKTLFSDIYFGAKKLRYFNDKKIVVLCDSAWINDKRNTLFADSIIYFQDSFLIRAYGNAILITGKDSFLGDSLYYNTKNKVGYAFEGYTLKEKGKIWGNTAYKDSFDNIYIKDGFYTTCDNDTPHYFFQAKYMKVIQKETAIAKPVVLRVHNVPLFAVPFWIFPVKEGRKSGFLTPHIGYNSVSGKYFKNLSYYLVVNNYMDLTASVDVVEKVGIRGNLDVVYKLYKRFGGTVKYSRAENLWPRKTEWSISAWHNHNLPLKTVLQMRVNYISSFDYYNQYSETTVEWLKKELYSYLTIRRTTGPLPFTITVDDRINPNRNIRQSLIPSLQYSLPPLPLFNMRISGGLLRKRIEDTTHTHIYTGMRNSIVLSYNKTILHYLRLGSIINSSLNILPTDTLNTKFVVQKSVTFQQTLSTTLYGFSIFGIPFLGIKKFIHILTPSVSTSYTPQLKNDSVSFQYGSLYRPGKQLNFSLQNSFIAKKNSENIPLFSINISSSYDFNQKRWNNIPTNFSLSERLPIKIRGNVTYNTETKSLENPSVFISSSIKLPLPKTNFETTPHDSDTISNAHNKNSITLNINYSITKNELFTSQTVSLRGGFKVSPSISGSYSISYDLSRGTYLSKSLTLKKDLHCWELTFSYNKYGRIWDYNFRIFIKKIPDIKIDKGFLKDLLP